MDPCYCVCQQVFDLRAIPEPGLINPPNFNDVFTAQLGTQYVGALLTENPPNHQEECDDTNNDNNGGVAQNSNNNNNTSNPVTDIGHMNGAIPPNSNIPGNTGAINFLQNSPQSSPSNNVRNQNQRNHKRNTLPKYFSIGNDDQNETKNTKDARQPHNTSQADEGQLVNSNVEIGDNVLESPSLSTHSHSDSIQEHNNNTLVLSQNVEPLVNNQQKTSPSAIIERETESSRTELESVSEPELKRTTLASNTKHSTSALQSVNVFIIALVFGITLLLCRKMYNEVLY